MAKDSKTQQFQTPTVLAAANIHPDHLGVCVEHCLTGTRHGCRLAPGTITLVRRTSGGTGTKSYGVVGIWYFTGQNEPVSRRENLWPSKWSTKVKFEPLVREFDAIWCEDFSIPHGGPKSVHKSSKFVPGLVYTKLQGNIVTIKDKGIAAKYIEAILRAKKAELQTEAEYLGTKVRVDNLLRALAKELKKQAK